MADCVKIFLKEHFENNFNDVVCVLNVLTVILLHLNLMIIVYHIINKVYFTMLRKKIYNSI